MAIEKPALDLSSAPAASPKIVVTSTSNDGDATDEDNVLHSDEVRVVIDSPGGSETNGRESSMLAMVRTQWVLFNFQYLAR